MTNHLTIGSKTLQRIGLGTNRIRNDDKSRDALNKAISLGIQFIDTASAYTSGQSEEVIGETLSSNNKILIATKGGMVAPDFHVDSRPETLSKQLENSLQKLKTDSIDLYFLHRVDPTVPLKESIQFLKEMQEIGKIKHIGLSEVSIQQIEEAREYIEVSAIENEYNLSERKYDDVVTYCEKEAIIFIPFFPLHFQIRDQNLSKKLQDTYNATEEQLGLAWLLKRSGVMLPIPGSLSADHLKENVDSLKIELNDEDFTALSSA